MSLIPHATITSQGERGYHCVEHSPGLDRAIVRALEQGALPYGAEWGSFIGARSIKAFPIDRVKAAVCYSRVSDRLDDHDRAGVLVCHCVVVDPTQFKALLRQPDLGFQSVFEGVSRDDSLPGRKLGLGSREPRPVQDLGALAQSFGVARRLRLLLGGRMVIRRRFDNVDQWKTVERSIQRIVLQLPISLGWRIPFATLTLSTSDPVKILGVPV